MSETPYNWQALSALVADLEAPVTLWWRDDDAHRADPQLDALLDLAQAFQIPVSLAVVPSWLQPSLASSLAPHRARVRCLLHGSAHHNHAPPEQKRCEYPPERNRQDINVEIQAGAKILGEQLAGFWRPVFVPPWNRFAPVHYRALTDAELIGFSAVSKNPPVPGMANMPVHIDIIDWQTRRFRGTEACLDSLAKTLTTSPSTPIGILTHHLDHDAGCWDFLRQLWQWANHTDGVTVVGVDQITASFSAS